MLEELSTLLTLAECRTMTRTANRLHLSQSAVSKRITKLEAELNRTLVEPKGRNVVLSAYAESLLERIRPLLSELRLALAEEKSDATGSVTIVIQQVLLLPWGAKVLAEVSRALPNVKFDIASALGAVAIEQVQSGHRMLAICTGTAMLAPDLVAESLGKEKMVLIPSGLKPFNLKQQKTLPMLFGESRGEGMQAIMRMLGKWSKTYGFKLENAGTYQSHASVVQMARAGFGHCIASSALAATLGILPEQLVELPKPGISIPISVLGRASTFSRPVVRKVVEVLRDCVGKEMEKF